MANFLTQIRKLILALPLVLVPVKTNAALALLPELHIEERSEVAEQQALSLAERTEFWQEQFARCIKCYACRTVCPQCFCEVWGDIVWPSHKANNK